MSNISAAQITPTTSVSAKASASIYVFPSELRDSTKEYPYMCFSIPGEAAAADIYVPIPAGLTFSDSMVYSTINLGIIGNIAKETINQAKTGEGLIGTLTAGVGGLASSTLDKAKKLNVAAAASIAARVARQDNIADIIDYSTKQLIAPNTNTTFQGSTIRNFNFTFKLVAKSQQEAKIIDNMIKQFRTYMYAKGNDVIMEYPPLWSIKFYNSNGNENTHIPKIYVSYLQSMTTTYNSGTNIFHDDGSPFEVDVSIGFQESKALNRTEILNLL